MKKKSILLLLPFAAMALAGCGDKPTPPPADPCESAVVQLNKTTLSLEVGASETLTASMSVEECDLGEVTWLSDHPEIAKVENGKVTGVSAGTAVISANGASCTVTVTPKIDPPGPGTDYGTEDNPLTVAKALAIMTEECANDGDLTKQAITVSGEVKNIRNVYHYTDDIGPDCFELDLTDGTSDVYVYRLHATAEVGANIALGSTVKLVGYAKNFKGTLEFVDNKESKCTALSAVKTSKVAVSISDVVGPAEVALNSLVAVSEVTLTVNYDDESKLEGQHPDSIDLDTTSAGEKTATVHYGEFTGSFNITVKNEESPNQFVDAYNAAAGLEYRSSTTESYNFKGVVVAKRGTEYYVQYEGYGIDVYGPSTAPAIGDLVEVNSLMKNFDGTIETGTINKIAILENEQELPAAAEVTSAEVLGNLKQNILANVAGTAKADITTIDTSKDYTLSLIVGTDEIPVFIKKAVLATLKDKLVGVKAGDAISITGAVTGEYKGTKQVLVVDGSTVNIPRPVSSVAFEEEAYSVLVGETVTVKANVLPEDADDKVVSYSLANPSVGVEATIDAETGVVTAGTVAGTVEVVATAHGDSTKTASVTLTITSAAIPVTGVEFANDVEKIALINGETCTKEVTAAVAPINATNPNVTYSIENTDVATVDAATGLVTAVAYGETTLTATSEDGGLTDTVKIIVTHIVEEGTRVIKATNNGVAYYMSTETIPTTVSGGKNQPKATTNVDEAAVFDFKLKEGSDDEYSLKVHNESKYLAIGAKDNNGVRYQTSEYFFKVTKGYLANVTGSFSLVGNDGADDRHVLLYNNADFRSYKTSSTGSFHENLDFDAVTVKEVDHIEITSEPTKKSYYVGDTLDITGLEVKAFYEGDVEGVVIDNSKLTISPKSFEAANEEKDITVSYQGKSAKFQVEVKVDDRTIDSIKIDSTSDMTNKNYNVGDAWNPAGLKVIAVRSDLSEFDVTKDATFTYSPTAPAADTTSVVVTAHYVVDDSTTLDSATRTIGGITVAAPDYSLDFSGTTAYTGMPASAAVDTKTSSFTVLSTDDWTQTRCYDSGKYIMLKTQSFVSGSDTSKEVAFIANAIALGGDVAKVEFDVMSGSSTTAVYQMKVASDAAITGMTDAQYSSSGDVSGKTVTFEVAQEGIKYIAIGATTAKNGQISAIRIYYK